MRERLIILFGVSLALAAMLACNAFAGQTGPSLPPPPATATVGTGSDAESGSGPGIAPTVTLPGSTPLPDNLPQVRILVDLNVRSGPGVQFRRAGFLLRGDAALVLGRDESSGWWQIVCPPTADSPECWVSGGSQYTRLEEPAQTPTP
ncbi:MAG: hypothetical protein R3C44_17045 [Chloroflexota bacterium]